jgi:hypothetical protein
MLGFLSFGFFSSCACVMSVNGRPIIILLIMNKKIINKK